MKIGKKLIVTFIMVAIISSIGGVVGVCIINNLVKNYDYALINYGYAQGDIGDFHAAFNDSGAIIRDIYSFN